MSAPVRIQWLGQAGFALRREGRLLLIDPYLSDSLAARHRGGRFSHERMAPPPLQPADVAGADWYLCTHRHSDHMDPATILGVARAGGRPSFLVPRAERDSALARGVPADRLVTIDAGERLSLGGGATVTAVAAAHERIERDAAGSVRCLGYAIELGGVRIYHSGDCVPYDGLVERLRELAPDVALLPVNGRSPELLAAGVPGNFSAREAVELCERAGIPELIPHHVGMFAFNTVAPERLRTELAAAARTVRWELPQLGAERELRPATARAAVEAVR